MSKTFGQGLVALLVLCLSGCTPEEIAGVQPEFIKAKGEP
jgi:sulfur transfer protein SufE